MFNPPSKKFLEDLAKVREKGLIKDPNSITERFKRKNNETSKPKTDEQLNEGVLNNGVPKPYLYGGKVYNTIRFTDVDSTNEFLKANTDHGVLDQESDGTIHVAHIHDVGKPKNGIVDHAINYEDYLNTVVKELTIFVENAPEFHSLVENIEIRKLTPEVPNFPIHLKALLEKERPYALWLQFGQVVAEEYERRFGRHISMMDIHEAVKYWLGEDKKLGADDDWTNQYTRRDQDRVYDAAGRVENWLRKRGHKRAMVSVSHGVEEIPHMGAKRTMGLNIQPDYKKKHEFEVSAKPEVERTPGYRKQLRKRVTAYRNRLASFGKDDT
jgi:hypothetical protein